VLYRSLGLFIKSAKFSIFAIIIPIRKKLKISLLSKLQFISYLYLALTIFQPLVAIKKKMWEKTLNKKNMGLDI
jgi:hypothetical protein